MQPNIYYFKDHHINPALIDPDALYVLERLRQAGFIAYLVGGSVRDLLINKIPKDFDISTSARPEQIKQLFQRQCILIGRRFRLAHIRFGHKIIEVATFRTGENDSDLIVHDNEWGTPQQDVLRRDFTINGLFYDAANHSVIDYVQGWEDIQTHTLRTIGEPVRRFKQDPVRLLRLLKFHARFGFNIDPVTNQATETCRHEILKSSPARILEELLRMLESGAAEKFLRLLNDYHLLPILFPELTRFIRTPQGKTIYHYLAAVDQLYHHKGKNTLDRAILASCLLYPIVEKELETRYLSKKHIPHIGEITLLISSLIKDFLLTAFSHFPRRISTVMASILITQFRFTPVSNRRHYREKIFRSKEFEFALTFLKIRALVNQSLVETYTSFRNQYRQISRPERKPNRAPSHKKEHV